MFWLCRLVGWQGFFFTDLGILDVLGGMQASAVIATTLILQKTLSLEVPGPGLSLLKQCLCLQSAISLQVVLITDSQELLLLLAVIVD